MISAISRSRLTPLLHGHIEAFVLFRDGVRFHPASRLQ
ncbi:hypothetical protein LC55x_2552 [Lysobacter capsici]|nr:hypothetical protein LC55x_2552 [Lysobacter capsici]